MSFLPYLPYPPYPGLIPVSTGVDTPLSTITSSSNIPAPIFNPFMYNPLAMNLPINPYLQQYPNYLSYQDINSDIHLKKQVVEYFHNKILNNWLKFHFNDLYCLLNVSGGKAVLIKNIADAKNNTKNDKSENDIKYEHLSNNYFTLTDILKLLSKFRKINNLNWWDIKHHSEKVRIYILYKVSKYMKQEIVN